MKILVFILVSFAAIASTCPNLSRQEYTCIHTNGSKSLVLTPLPMYNLQTQDRVFNDKSLILKIIEDKAQHEYMITSHERLTFNYYIDQSYGPNEAFGDNLIVKSRCENGSAFYQIENTRNVYRPSRKYRKVMILNSSLDLTVIKGSERSIYKCQ